MMPACCKMLLQLCAGNGRLNHKLIKERSCKGCFEAWKRGNLAECIVRFLQAQFAQFAEALFAKCGHIDSGTDREQRLIGADIRGGAFAANMLLASLQCQHVARLFALALLNGLSDEAPGEQAHKLLFRGHKAERGPAIAHGIAEAHEFAYRDIGAIFAWRGQQAQRSWFGDVGDEERFALCAR